MPTLLTEAEGHMSTGAKASPGAVLRGRRPLACTDTPCARTGRSSARPPKLGGTHREGRGRTPMTNGQRKSDRLVVPTKPPNKAGGTRLRRWWREGAWPRRRWESKTRPRHRAGQCVSSALPRLRQAAVRFDVIIRGKSPVREQRSLGSVRGAVRADKAKGRPYRDRRSYPWRYARLVRGQLARSYHRPYFSGQLPGGEARGSQRGAAATLRRETRAKWASQALSVTGVHAVGTLPLNRRRSPTRTAELCSSPQLKSTYRVDWHYKPHQFNSLLLLFLVMLLHQPGFIIGGHAPCSLLIAA